MPTAYERVRRVIVQQARDGVLDRSVPDLARLTRCSSRTVQRVLMSLREEGELRLARAARQHYPAVYETTGSLAAEIAHRSSGTHLAAVPGVTPGTTPGVTMSCLPGAPRGGDYRGGARKPSRTTGRRRTSRADGTNPRAEQTRAAERNRSPLAFTRCHVHDVERNGLGMCSGCRADELAAGAG